MAGEVVPGHGDVPHWDAHRDAPHIDSDAPRVVLAEAPPIVMPRAANWPSRTWNSAERVTAGMLNSWRDQLNELHTNDVNTQANITSMQNQIAALNANLTCGVYVITTASGTISNYPLDHTHRVHIVACSNTGDLFLNGFTPAGAAGAQVGDRVHVLAINSGNAFLQHYTTSNEKFWNMCTTGPTPLAGYRGSATYAWVAGSWVLQSHDQGWPFLVPFNAANFTAGGGTSPTFTVAAGNVLAYYYTLKGSMVRLGVQINNASNTGGPTALRCGGWPFQIAGPGNQFQNCQVYGSVWNANAWGPGWFVLEANGATYISVFQLGYAAWPAGATYIYAGGWFQTL
jgi:hypothetical protein